MAIQVSPTTMHQGRKSRQLSKRELANQKIEQLRKNADTKKKNDEILRPYYNRKVPIAQNISSTKINPITGQLWDAAFLPDDEGGRTYMPADVENKAAQFAFLKAEADAAQTVKVREVDERLLNVGVDPATAAALSALAIPSLMEPKVGRGVQYGQLGEFAKAIDILDPGELVGQTRVVDESEALDAQGNLKPNYNYVTGEKGFEGGQGRAPHYTHTPSWSTEANRLIEEGWAPINTAEKRGGLQERLMTDQITYNEGEKIRQEAQTHSPVSKDILAGSIMGYQRDTRSLRSAIHETIQQNPELTEIFEAWVKEDTDAETEGYLNAALNLGVLLAFDESVQNGVYADFSDKQKQEFAEYQEANEGEYDPRLWKTKDNRVYRTPRYEAFEQSFPENIEKIFGVDFPSRMHGQVIANAYLQAIQNTNIRGVSIELDRKNPRYHKDARIIVEDKEGLVNNEYPMQDIWVDREARMLLNHNKGLRDLLHPQLRNHVRFEPKETDIRDLIAVSNSPIRARMQIIQESLPRQISQPLLAFINHVYNRDDKWNEFMEGRDVKLKAQHFHIINQENQYIKDNSPDGRTYYIDKKPRPSGRTGDENLLMADIKPVRALTESAGKGITIKLSGQTDPNKYNLQERAMVTAIMQHLGYENKLWEPTLRDFIKLAQPNSEARLLGRALNEIGDPKRYPQTRELDMEGEAVLSEIPDILKTPDRLINSGLMTNQLDSVQALRALDSFLTTKEKHGGKVKKFITKYITSADAAQSGPTIQGFQIGNWMAFRRGGGITRRENWITRPDKEERLELERMYQEAANTAMSNWIGLREEDGDLEDFAKMMFAKGDGVLDETNLFNKSITKDGSQGAGYGQMEAGSRAAISEILIQWMMDGSAEDIRNRVSEIRGDTRFGEDSVISSVDNPNEYTFTGEAMRQVNKLANMFVEAMYATDRRLLDYSQEMRTAFNTYIRLLEFGGKVAGDGAYNLTKDGQWKAPHWQYKEPMDWNNVYGSKAKWGNGKVTKMINENIPGTWKWYGATPVDFDPTEGGETGLIWYKEGEPEPDVNNEIQALIKRDPLYRSTGVTRFPVISVHGLDDLVISIALSEMVRKINAGHYEKFGINKEDGLDFFMSVWDQGRVSPTLLDPWIKEYNKAFLEVMKRNQFLSQIGEAFHNMMYNIPKSTYNKIQRTGHLRTQWDKLVRSVKRIQQHAEALRKGDFIKGPQGWIAKEGVTDKDVGGIEPLLEQASNTAIMQMGAPSIAQNKRIEQALKGTSIFNPTRPKTMAEMRAENRKRKLI